MPDQSSAATEHAILQEITQPLEALHHDALAEVNADFPTALRGYDRFAVDEYVRQTRQLVAEMQATRSPEAAVRRALERVGEQISGILQRAHETSEQITAQSRSEAEDRLEQARVEAEQIADAAGQRVRELDADTDRIWLERQRIVADAEDLAGQLTALARTAGERFPADEESAPPPEPDDALAGDETLAWEDEPPTAVAGAPAPPPAPADGDFDAGDHADEDEHGDGRPEQSEIERTVAFQPLPPREATPPPAAPARAPSVADDDIDDRGRDEYPPAGGVPRGPTSSVIPPASQAANRRLQP